MGIQRKKRSLLVGETGELDRKTAAILTGYQQVLRTLPMLRIKGKTEVKNLDLFSKRNWPIYSWRVVSCVFKWILLFRVCSLVFIVSL